MARIGSYPIDAVVHDKDAWIGTENTNRVTRQFTAKGIADYIDTKNVGQVFVGATALADGKKGLVPAPVAGQEGMYLKGDLGGGWTTIPVYTLDVPAGTTNVNLINTDGAGAIINSFITLTGGTYLTSVHTSGSQITFNHDNTTRSDTTSTASPAAGASVPLVASVTSNATGHVTAIDVKTVTWPADSDTTYTIDVPNATTSINLAGSDGSNDPIAFTTVAGNNGMTISRTDANTLNFNSKWQINNVNQDGYVPKGLANANKFWATDSNGNPGWTFQPSQDQTISSTGTTNASTGIVLSQNGGTVIIKGDGTTINASSNNNTNTITLAAINRVNTTYTLPTTNGSNPDLVLTASSGVTDIVNMNGTANEVTVEGSGTNTLTFGLPDDVTVAGELTVSGTGQSSFGGQVTIPQTPVANTDAASKKYVDDLVSGGLTFRGTFRADTGEILSGVNSGSKLYNCPGGAGTRIAVAVGDYYIVATAGGAFYCSGATLDIGDSIIATAAANADASVVTGWSVVQSDEGVVSFTNANGTFVSAGTVNNAATGAVTMGTIDLSATGTKNNTTFLRGDNTWAVPAYVSYSAMTTSTLGLGKIKYDFGSTPAAESQSTTANRTYGVTKNGSDQLVVNVPWLNSSDVNSVTASGATTALSGLSSTPNTGSVVIGLDIHGRASLGAPASDDELMIYDTSTAKNVKVLVSDLASYAGSAATNQVTYWTSANEIGGATGFTFAGGANGAVTMGGNLTVSGLTTIKRTGITGVAKADMTLQIGYEGNNGQNNLIGFGYNGQTNVPAYIGYTTTSGSGSTKGDLVFGTRGVTTDSAPSERMRITSAGAVEIKGSSTTTSAQAFITNDNSVLSIGSSVSGSVVKDISFNSPSPMMYIDGSSGSVGIGVTDPDYTLHLLKSSGDTEMYINGQNGQSSLRMGLDARNWQIKTAAAPYLWSLNYVGTDVPLSNIITATVGGSVGIGTDSPSRELDIQASSGWAELALRGNTGGGGSLEFWTNTTKRAEIFADTEDIVFRNTATNQERMRIESGGTLTVGGQTNTRLVTTITENSKVDLNVTDGTSTARALSFSTGGTVRVVIDANGSVYNNSGTGQTFFGSNNAGNPSSVTGASNSSFGYGAGNALTTGTQNVSFGRDAGGSMTTAVNNVNIGTNAGLGNTDGIQNTYVGTAAGYTSPGQNYNTFVGYEAGYYNEANDNTAVGRLAMHQNTTGTRNVAVGVNALRLNTTADGHVAVGYLALENNTTGSSNTALGYQALDANTIGDANLAIGANTLGTNTEGDYNVAVGHQALSNNTTQNKNSALGYRAGYFWTGGDENTFIGYNSGFSSAGASTGGENTLVGSLAGGNTSAITGAGNTSLGRYTLFALTSGSYNTALGHQAGGSLSTGDANTLVGKNAGDSIGGGSRNSTLGQSSGQGITIGSDNIAIGYEAMFTNVGGGQNVAIGVNAARDFTGNRLVAIGTNAAKQLTSDVDNVFIGQDCGHHRLSGVDNTFVGAYANYNGNATGCCNTGFGKSTGYELTSGVQNTFLGRQAGYSVTTADNNTMVGHNAGIYATGGQNTLIGSGAGDAITTGNHNNIFGYNCEASSVGGTDQIVIGTNGQVGKGNSTGFISPGTGGVYQGNNSTTWSTTSDKRIKKNIVDNNKGLEIIDKIQVRNFEYRTEEEIIDFENPKSAVVNQEGIQLGVIAQEIEKVLPEVVTEESTGVKTVNVDNLTWYLINAVKELKAEIEILKNK